MLFTAALAPLTSVQANTPFDGFYTGAGVGLSLTSSSLYSTGSGTLNILPLGTFDLFSTSSTKESYKKNSGLGALFAGYGYSCDPLYIGGELFLKFNNTSVTNYNIENSGSTIAGLASNLSDITTLKFRKTEFALDIRPGILLSDTNLFYARVGITRNKVSLSLAETTSFRLGGISPVALSQAQTKSKNIFGVRLGLGTEQMICECVALRMDYIYTRYRRVNFDASTNVTSFDPLAGANVNVSISESLKVNTNNHAFMLGLNYYW